MLNGIFTGLISNIPYMILSVPVIFFSLSVHETAHGFAAHKLGDPTARSLGRLTLNPLKHLDPMGFICMLLFGMGWAKPVPVNSRYFKNPRRDMAITAAAGPISNLLLALIFAVIMRLVMIPLENITAGNYLVISNKYWIAEEVSSGAGFVLLSLLVILCYIGITLNLALMIFNLIPLPPLDGSRIAYIFLPANIYFGIMKYERYIMLGFLVLLYAFNFTGLPNPISSLVSWITDGLFAITGISEDLFTISYSEIMSRLSF